ncbi:MAG TPA: polyprenyl synthetase family protein, partial [Ktedonobacterales bacterium]|nr:polyprenyl synthetase family protein [Ktedonobacterales bacterium]
MSDQQAALGRFRESLTEALRAALAEAQAASDPQVVALYSQIEYHLGWRGADLAPLDPAQTHSGKLLRPTLTLYACELAALASGALTPESDGEHTMLAERAMPAAVAVELVHNFSLIHDDIEDGDEERHHYPTLWKLWGQPQAINTGDALFALARAQMWGLAGRDVSPALVVRAGRILDRACLDICEGQYLDMSFEGRQDVTVAQYFAMIDRKTAALMRCAAELGGRIGAPENDELGDRLADFGRALGLAFQLRDDLLGIWAAKTLGKT